MSLDVETIYALLPEIYRTRDAAIAESMPDLVTPAEKRDLEDLRALLAAGVPLDETQQRDLARLERKRLHGPLKALLSIVAEQAAGLEENVEQLYDDQFIETCADWAVPYIADLVGYRPLDPDLQRQLGSGRAEVANTIRFRRRKGTSAVLEELSLDITDWDSAVIELFQRLATTQYLNHVRTDQGGTVEVRRADALEEIGTAFDRHPRTADVRRIGGASRPNIPNVGIFLWRIGARRLTDSPAFSLDTRRFRFDPLGRDIQLFNVAARETEVTRLAGRLDVPMPITRRMLRSRLAELYGPGLSLSVRRGSDVLGAGEVEACDLSDVDGGWAHSAQQRVAIDPTLGRIMFPAPVTEDVTVTFHYGSVADIGGGEYDRTTSGDAAGAPRRRIPEDRPSISAALADLDGEGALEITGSGVYHETPSLVVAANSRLTLRAATASRPLLRLGGDLIVAGGDSGEVTLDGLVITGGRLVIPKEVGGKPNRLQRLRIVHCTLVPSALESLMVQALDVDVEIERSIVGALRVTDSGRLAVADSIIDAGARSAVALEAPGGGAAGPLDVDGCTVIGKGHTTMLTASNSILDAARAHDDAWPAALVAERGQAGYLRYSYAPLDSKLPPRYECRPRNAIDARMMPRYTAEEYGEPGYLQLHTACPRELRCGAADGGEMGAYHHLYAPQRVDALYTRLDEYLRFGLDAGLIFAS
jgi:hypothetical protein